MMPTLRLGSRGAAVGEWQDVIGARRDEVFGRETERLTREWQSACGLFADGIVGPITWETAAGIAPPANIARRQSDERIIRGLHWTIQEHARALLREGLAEGLDLIITQGLRSMQEQADLFARGRSQPGPIVTRAPAGYSWHNFGLAFDVAIFDGARPTWPEDLGLWLKVGEIGEDLGFEWGGRWDHFRDLPHFQRLQGLTLAAARRGVRPSS